LAGPTQTLSAFSAATQPSTQSGFRYGLMASATSLARFSSRSIVASVLRSRTTRPPSRFLPASSMSARSLLSGSSPGGGGGLGGAGSGGLGSGSFGLSGSLALASVRG